MNYLRAQNKLTTNTRDDWHELAKLLGYFMGDDITFRSNDLIDTKSKEYQLVMKHLG